MSEWVWIFKFESWLRKSAQVKFFIWPHNVRAQWTNSNSPRTLSRTKAALWFFLALCMSGTFAQEAMTWSFRLPTVKIAGDADVMAVTSKNSLKPPLGFKAAISRIVTPFYLLLGSWNSIPCSRYCQKNVFVLVTFCWFENFTGEGGVKKYPFSYHCFLYWNDFVHFQKNPSFSLK